MTTARDMIKSALRKISVLGRGSALDNDEAQEALDLLNGILASWTAEGNLVFQKTVETFPLTGSTSYTIGTGADFNTDRPYVIDAVTVRQGTLDYSLFSMSQEQYAGITLKTQGGSIPDSYYYDGNFPTATIYFYPVPSGATSTTIYSRKQLDQFTGLTDTFDMPEEYRLALEYALAEAIAPEYEREASMTVKKYASKFKKTVTAQNQRTVKHLSRLDIPEGQNRYNTTGNIYRGYD
jgi:hypothetical protein